MGAHAEPLPAQRNDEQTLARRQEPPHPQTSRRHPDAVGTEGDVNCPHHVEPDRPRAAVVFNSAHQATSLASRADRLRAATV